MSWMLCKEFSFEASHILVHHSGKCANLHGHSWTGRVILRCQTLQTQGSSTGMGIDYADISAALKPLVEKYLDHHHLNDSLDMESPTSEAIAEWLHDRLYPVLGSHPGVELWAVDISETRTSWCRYYGSILR